MDSIDDGKMTCSPPHTDSNPTCSASLQISTALLPSVPMLLANAKPNFIYIPISLRCFNLADGGFIIRIGVLFTYSA